MKDSRSFCGIKRYDFILCAILVLVDRASKWHIVESFSIGESREVIPRVLSLTFVANKGAAFGLMPRQSGFFAVMATVVAAALACFLAIRANRLKPIELFAVVLILAGTTGNLWDRIRVGFIIDFIDLGFWPVFNFADAFITTGAVLLMGRIALKGR